MIDRDLLLEAIGYIDDCFIDKYFVLKNKYEREKHKRKAKRMIAIAASTAAVLICAIVVMFSVFNTPSKAPTKPDLNEVVWLENKIIDVLPNEYVDKHMFAGIEVSEYLYKYLNDNEDGCICISLITDNSYAYDAAMVFKENGIYAEEIKDKIFAFITREDIEKLKLTESQKKSWKFVWVSEVYYNQCVSDAPIKFVSDITDWLGIKTEKFSIRAGSISKDFYTSEQEFMRDYDQLCSELNWDPEACIFIIIFYENNENLFFEYLDYKNIYFDQELKYAGITLELNNWSIQEIRNLSDDSRIRKVYISLSSPPIPTYN